MKHRICHFLSVHPRFDTRIFLKECKTLSNSGYNVTIVVADDKPDEIKDGISIINVNPKRDDRFTRIFLTSWMVYRKARELDADVYHFHDPELLPYALLLMLKKKKVIYDVHEDFPRDIYSKYWIWKPLRSCVSFLTEVLENFVSRRLSFIIAATPHIEKRFLKINRNTININNYPLPEELFSANDWSSKDKSVCYIGNINVERGIYEVVESLSSLDYISLELGGTFESDKIEETAKAYEGWKKVNYHGYVNRDKAKEIMAKCVAGLVIFHPHPNHIYAQPNKIFEYMSAGLPVIGSDFPLWQKIIKGNGCGLCVNPLSPPEISEAIRFIADNPQTARKMGEKGRQMVENEYSWDFEKIKLLNIYSELLN